MVEAGGGRRHRMTLESGDHTLTLCAYRTGPIRTVLFYTLAFLTLGISALVLYWKQKWSVKVRMVPCSFRYAEYIYIIDNHNVTELVPVHREYDSTILSENGEMREISERRWFVYRKLDYVWMDESEAVSPAENADVSEFGGFFKTSSDIADRIPCRALLGASERNEGLSSGEIRKKMEFYGKNEIVVQLRPILYLLFMEVITPFYVFQIFRAS